MELDTPGPQETPAPPADTVPPAEERPAPPRWPPPWERRVLGKRIPPSTGADRSAGRVRGTDEMALPGMLHGSILRCPFAHARIVSLDLAGAAQAPGVRAVVALAEKDAVITYSGQEIAAAAAADPQAARAALRRADVRYEPLPFSVDASSAAEERLEIASQGEVGAALKDSRLVAVEAEYRTAPMPVAATEPAVVLASWDAPDRLRVWAPTPDIHALRAEVARSLGIGVSQVEVCCENLSSPGADPGILYPTVAAAARLARDAGAPVRIALGSGEGLAAAGTVPGVSGTVKVAADRDGKLAALRVRARVFPGPASAADPGMPLPHIHACERFRVECTSLRANVPGPSGSWLPGAAFLVESALDELAHALGMDPVELRKRNEPEEARRTAYDMGAERILWERRNPTPGAGTGVKRRGMGVAACVARDAGAPGALATVTLHRDGSAEVRCSVGDLPGLRSTLACVVAEEVGLQPRDVAVAVGVTSLGPGPAGPAAYSLSSAVAPVKAAASQVRSRLLTVAAPWLGADAQKLGAGTGKVYVRDDPERSLTWRQVCAKLPEEGICGVGQWVEGVTGGDAAGIHFAEVEVDVETGGIAVPRLVAVYDCGVVLDSLATQTRIEAGVMAGIGQALVEERVWDEPHGIPLDAAPGGAPLPGFAEAPEIEVIFVGRPEAVSAADPGDAALMGTAAALANAVYNATGVRIRQLPLSRATVLKALGGH